MPFPAPHSRTTTVGAFALATAIFSTTWMAIKLGLDHFPPFGYAGLRFLIALPILVGLAFAMRAPWPARPRDWTIPIVLGFTMFTVPFSFIYLAERTVPSGLSAVLFASHAIFVALFAHVFLRDERLSVARALGVVLGFAGVVVVFRERMAGHASWSGEALLLATSALQAGSNVMIRRTQAGLHPLVLSAIGAAVAAPTLLAISAVREHRFVHAWSVEGVALLVYLAIFGSVIGFTLSVMLLHRIGSTRVAMIAYIAPIAALVWGRIFLGEAWTGGLALGSALVVVGVWLASRSRRS